ncbi:dynamin family protein [Actinomycetospora sp. TBRC 11914]|uniref:dynamin family protein n=1 Tax=Actinomycetospora sp. TBRC 11914 TaxID=2729387 RepID=UPI00145F3753|nr:dynamin family protein [Actinomycetospora sp. TBRC 11914]NMO93254.1 Isoniazid-inducible protein iniA [Actinomycetospora sp. TBRC 11914]
MTDQPTGAELTELVALARRAATAYDRPDLERRLAVVARAVEDDRARVLVVGEFKAGKTELVNALLGGRALPTDAHRATTVPTVCGHGEQAGVVLVRGVESPEGSGPSVEHQSISPGALAEHVTENGNPDNRAGWSHAEATLPRPVLEGLRLVDTPGAGGLASPAAVSTMAELPGADAVLVVADAGRELTAPELALVRTAAAVSPAVVVVLTRTDLHPHWRRIADIDRGHLDRTGHDALRAVRVLPTSAALALHAAEDGDLPPETARALAEESGVEELRHLLSEVAQRRQDRRVRLATDEVLVACEQFATTFRAERDALADPARAQRIAAEVERARNRAAGLRDRAARWQQTLNDGVADLVSDIEYDLRDRLRAVITDAEAALDDTDPGKTWEQFAPWLHQQVSAGVSTNVVWAEERTRWLAEKVATHFAEDGEGVLPPVTVGASPDGAGLAADPVAMLAAPDHEKFGVAQSLMIGMRGSYGGVLMIGMLTTIAGMALLNPFSVGAGLLLGSKTLVDERKRALRRRQAEAKQAVRRHVDDVIFQAGKNSRDMLREVQRTLRDHFTTTAEELERSLSATADAARAVEADGAKRAARLADVEAELERVAALAERARRERARRSPSSSRPSRLVGA